MFIFRQITEEDFNLEFITGNIAFNELSPDKTLNSYLKEDSLKGGEYDTYLLLEIKSDGSKELLGLLRYKESTINDFFSEISKSSSIKLDLNQIKNEILKKNYIIIYLSRIGIPKKYQEMRLSQVIINFFEFLIQRNKENTLIYVKVLREISKIIGSSYDIVAESYDEKWGEFCIGIKNIEYEK